MEINYLAVIGAAIASMVVGMFWYSPAGFGKQWMALSGLTEADMNRAKARGMSKLYFIAFVGSLLTSYVLARFSDYMGASTVLGGLELGFWVWLGFVATTLLGPILWEGKPAKLYFLNASYQLVNLAIMGIILSVWK